MGPKPISKSKLLLFGFLMWLIPFVVSVPLVGRDGQPILPTGMFKSLMIVVGSGVGAWPSCVCFANGQRSGSRAGRRPPLAWHNVVLDLLILVPMTNMGLGDYAGEIALRYLVIPIMAVAIGAAAGPSGDAG